MRFGKYWKAKAEKERKNLSEPEVKLNNLNKYFCGIYYSIDNELLDYDANLKFIIQSECNEFNFVNKTPDEIYKAVKGK